MFFKAVICFLAAAVLPFLSCTHEFTNPYHYCPNPPSDVVAQALSSSSIQITWKDNSDNEDGFYVEGGAFAGSRDSIHQVSANDTDFIDDNLLPNTRYYYVVKAHLGDSVYSAFSAEVECSTLP